MRYSSARFGRDLPLLDSASARFISSIDALSCD
jgi:hypothetical protein